MASRKNRKADKKAKKEQEEKKSKKKGRGVRKKNQEKIPFGSNNWIALFGILAITLLCFTTAIPNDFVNWDDDRNFYENDNITTLNKTNFWKNTKQIFQDDVIGGYNPLSIWTFALEQRIYSTSNKGNYNGLDNPSGWHRDNVLLHLMCTLFVFLIGRKLGLKLWACVLFAALFGIHPMRVESVAWVTERKDVLFGVFYLAAMYYYLKYVTEEKKISYMAIIWITFILSLFSKIQAVIFPITMVLIDYYFDGKLDIKKMLRKIPFFLASLAVGILGIQFLGEQGSLETNETFSLGTRIFIGSYQYTIYLVKSLVPFRLSPLYPYPAEIPFYFYISFLSFILSGVLMYVAYMRKWKVVFFGLGFFIANIFFLLQILGAGQGFLADRFTYIAYIGLFFMFAWGFQTLIDKKPNLKIPALVVSGLLLAGYGFMTYQQNKIWKNSGTLWSHVLQYYKNSTLPYGNRANYYRDNGETQKALKDYNDRIRLKQDDAGVFNSRGRLYFNFSSRDSLIKALSDYNKAIELDPGEAEYHVNRGATYAKLGDMDNALSNLNEGIKLDPSFTNAYLNRSVIFNQRGDFRSALNDITTYLKYKPYHADMWYEKSRLHNAVGEGQQGLESINKAISYGQEKAIYLIEKAKSHYSIKQFNQAKSTLQRAIDAGANVEPQIRSTIMSGGG